MQTAAIGHTTPNPRSEPVKVEWLTHRNTLRVLGVLIFLALWQAVGSGVGPVILSTPAATAAALVDLAITGELWVNTWATVQIFLIGFALSLVAGVALGTVVGRFNIARDLSDVWVTVFWATPTIALLPLLVEWFGLTVGTKLALVFLSALWPIIINTQVGMENVDQTLIDVARAFGARGTEIIRYVVIRAAAPYVLAGIRIAVGRAIIGVFVAELFTSTVGLGARMTFYSNFFKTANYFALLLVLVLFSVITTEIVRICERKLELR